EGRVWRIGRRVDGRGSARVFEDAGVAWHFLHEGRPTMSTPGVHTMRTVVVDKVASIAQACGLSHEVRIATNDIPCEEGVVLVVEVLTNKSTYNTLELTSGRMAKVARGDIIVGALGHRQALFGYS